MIYTFDTDHGSLKCGRRNVTDHDEARRAVAACVDIAMDIAANGQAAMIEELMGKDAYDRMIDPVVARRADREALAQ